jgi:hypothetical protein
MIRVLWATDALGIGDIRGSAEELAEYDFVVAGDLIVKDRTGSREGQHVDDVEAWLHDLARDNPGRAADVELTRRAR